MPKSLKVFLGVCVSLLVLIGVASVIGNMIFNAQVDKEIEALLSSAEKSGNIQGIVVEDDLENLPSSVKRWLLNSNVIGKPRTETVYLQQKAALRLGPDKPWLPAEAEQYFTVVEPGFIWKADIKMFPMVNIVGRDKYQQGRGHMLIKVLSLIAVADSKGEEIDQGTMLRFLGEMSWFPTAALSEYVTWEELDANRARATISYGGVTASGVFAFDEKGHIVSFEAKRYMDKDGEFSLEDWVIEMKEYKEFNGVVVPNKVDVIWRLETGDFHWFSCEVTGVEYTN